MTADQTGDDADLAYWRALAEVRGEVIQALHEFDYWHQSAVSRGAVIAGLEESVALWRARCETAEARLAAPPAGASGAAAVARRGARAARRQADRLVRARGGHA